MYSIITWEWVVGHSELFTRYCSIHILGVLQECINLRLPYYLCIERIKIITDIFNVVEMRNYAITIRSKEKRHLSTCRFACTSADALQASSSDIWTIDRLFSLFIVYLNIQKVLLKKLGKTQPSNVQEQKIETRVTTMQIRKELCTSIPRLVVNTFL